MLYPFCDTRRGYRGKPLGGNSDRKAYSRKKDKKAAHFKDVIRIAVSYTLIYHGSHYKRHKEVKEGLKELKKRP